MSGALDAMFAPAGVVVVGASADPGKLGSAMARSLAGFPGPVLLVNGRNPDPSAGVYATVSQAVAETGSAVDLAVFCLPACATPPAVAEAAAPRGRPRGGCARGVPAAGPPRGG